jgi:hypothetical protein
MSSPSLAQDKPIPTVRIPQMEETHLMGHEYISYEPPHPRLFSFPVPVAPVTEKNNFTVYQAPSQPPSAITPAFSWTSPPPAFNSRKRRRTEEASASQETARFMSELTNTFLPFPPQSAILPVPENQSSPSTLPLYASQAPVAIRATPSQVSLQHTASLESRKRERGQEPPLSPLNIFATQPRETEIYAEIQALVAQEVMRTRYYQPLSLSLTSGILRRRGNWRLSTLLSRN